MKIYSRKMKYKGTISALCIGLLLLFLCPLNASALSWAPSKYTIDLDFTVKNKAVGFIFGSSNRDHMYMWQLNAEKSPFRLRPHFRKNGQWPFYTDVNVPLEVVPDAQQLTTNHMQIAIDGVNIKTYINGVLVDDRIDDSRFINKFGRFGMRVNSQVDHESGSIDNLIIKDSQGKEIYSNDFEVAAPEFPGSVIVNGALENKPDVEFSLCTLTDKYSIDVDMTSPAGAAGIIFGGRDNDNLYMWQYSTEKYPARLRPHKRISGNWVSVKDIDLPSIAEADVHAKHHLRLDIKGELIVSSVDGSIVDSLYSQEFGFGLVGFREDSGDKQGAYDNLVVKDSTGKVLYTNDFTQNPPFNFPDCISVDGKLKFGETTGEFQMLRNLDKLVTTELITPRTHAINDSIVTVKLTSHSADVITNLPIKYQMDNGTVVEEVVASIPAFGSVNYSFTQKHGFAKEAANVTVNVWSTLDSISIVIENLAFDASSRTSALAWSPSKYTMDLDFTVHQKSMGFIFGSSNDGSMYMWQLNCEKSPFRLRPHIRKNGNWPYYTDVNVPLEVVSDAQQFTTNHMQIAVDGDSIKTYINGTLIDARKDDVHFRNKFGRIGIRCHPGEGEKGSIDNVIIKDSEGKVLYSNDFSISAREYSNGQIINGALENKDGQEWNIGQWMDKYSVDVDIASENKTSSLLFGGRDNNNFYMWQLNTEKFPVRLRPHKRISGNWVGIKDIDLPSIAEADKNAEHHLRVEVSGQNILSYVDGIKVDSINSQEYGFGLVGFREDSQDIQGAYDNLVVRDATGKVLYTNDFNQNPPFNFPDCISVDGKLRFSDVTGEFQLMKNLDKKITSELLTPVTNTINDGTVTVKLTSHSANEISNLPIKYQFDNFTVVEEVVGSIPAFGSVNYTFTQKHVFGKDAKTVTVSVWSTLDSISTVIDNLPVITSIDGVTPSTIVVYPNPTSGKLNIQLSNTKDAADVQVSTMLGTIVKTVTIQGNSAVVDLTELPDGLYLVKVKSGNLVETLKVTKK